VAAAFTHWSASWPALGCYVIVAAAHLAGWLRLGAGPAAGAVDHRARARAALLFQAGLLLALLAIVSPVGYWADRYLWVHALQFILLAVAATGLMVLGAPWRPLRQAVRPRAAGAGQPAVPGVPSMRSPRPVPLPVRHPVAAIAVVNLVWLGWQLPAPVEATRGSSAIALIYFLTILAAGLVGWLQLIGSEPVSPAAPPLGRLPLVVATAGVSTIGGMVLVFGSGVLYSGYANQWHHVMTVLDDQQLSGAVFWMGMLPPLIIVAVALLLRWLSDEESADLSAGLDRLLTPRKNAWSARPGIR
jgi:cytochrome c oxidase assembly factor CtaG